jgi:hypothetical protein
MDNFNLRKYLAEGKLFEEDNTTYALHITTVEYDNGKPGYTYEVVDLDTEEEVGSKFGFKPLYFVGSGDKGDQQVFKGQDFNSIKTYGMYQDKVVNKEESLEIYKGLINGEDFYEKFSFDPRDLAEGKLLKEDYGKESLIKALGDADDAFIQLGDGREFIIYNPNSNNDDNVDMWDDYSVFALDQDGEEHEILYSDIAGINL